jgi:hypothetical protein
MESVVESKVTCPVCESKKMCLESRTETFSSYMCFRCGFMSNSTFTEDDDQYKDYLNSSPKIVVDSSFLDTERDIYWLPVILNVPEKGIVYPKNNEETNYDWIAQTYIQSDREGFDMELSDAFETFDKYNFFEAAKSIGIHLTEEEPEVSPKTDGFSLA